MEYRDRPESFVQPTREELRARNIRNYAIAAVALGFMVAVFLAMIARAGYL